jgi:hypothetical protein
VLKLLGKGSMKILTKLMNTIYETRELPKDFTEVTMIALKKKTQATKCYKKQQKKNIYIFLVTCPVLQSSYH